MPYGLVPPDARAAKKRERLLVSVENHLLALPGIRPDEKHPAVAKTRMRNLRPSQLAAQNDVLVAPAELVHLARIETLRIVSIRNRTELLLLPPLSRISPNRVAAALGGPTTANPRKSASASNARASDEPRSPTKRVKLRSPSTDLRTRLRPALADELRRLRPQNLLVRHPRHAQIPADPPDRTAVPITGRQIFPISTAPSIPHLALPNHRKSS